jgi:hypothetical protein
VQVPATRMAARMPITIPISRLVNARLSGCPTELTFTFHWLAVNSSQPLVPESQSEIGSQVVAIEEIAWPQQDAVSGCRLASRVGISSEEHQRFIRCCSRFAEKRRSAICSKN